MASKFAEKRQDDLNRFYTRTAVGELMVDQLGGLCPQNVLDLGAGAGSLSMAVVGRWNDTQSVTVDLDPSITTGLHNNIAMAGGLYHRHFVHDVLDPALPTLLHEHGRFDLAVCNPPFFRPAWNREFARILQHADMSEACRSTADVTAEILFLAQSLRLLRAGGKMVLIAPDGLITGARMSAFRRAILHSHSVDCVVQLPKHSFHDTEARCFILVLSKGGGPTEAVKLLRYDAETGVSDPIRIQRNDAELRMDFDYHSKRDPHTGRATTLRQLGADVKRGSLTTVARKAAQFPVFHTTDYRDLDGGLIVLENVGDLPQEHRLIFAETGDILMARVDRKLQQKVGIVVSGRVPVTDCVYRVRVPAKYREPVFEALRSPAGEAGLLAATKGVSARLLGKADLLDLPLQLDL